jgi:ectoine hydroxylase-related dioxygenase (phytanoyl-CoA dioxygenase family)
VAPPNTAQGNGVRNGVDGVENVSLWVPLDPVPDSIALRCIRGSHRWGKRFIPRKFVNQEAYITNAQGFEHLPDHEILENDPDIGLFPAEVGDVVAFHFRTLHSAPGTEHHNAGRRVVSFRYVGDDARWAQRPWTTSPPFPDNGLNPGDLLDEARFPLTN